MKLKNKINPNKIKKIIIKKIIRATRRVVHEYEVYDELCADTWTEVFLKAYHLYGNKRGWNYNNYLDTCFKALYSNTRMRVRIAPEFDIAFSEN